MSRLNIFELIAKNNNMASDVSRLDKLFDGYYLTRSCSSGTKYSLKEFVDDYCFNDWLNCGRCLDVKDYLATLQYTNLKQYAALGDLDAFLTLIEVIYNFWFLAESNKERFSDDIEFYSSTEYQLKYVMDDCLSEYNQKAFYFEEEERCIIAEDSPQVTAAAEASSPDIALEIVRYNHRQLSGDIAKKKTILKALGDHLEGRRREISGINDSLYKTITGALNNLNIRHNNISPENKSYYHEAVAEMPDEELEQHYDNLYQLILLAILEMDNKERQREMKELVQAVTAKEIG